MFMDQVGICVWLYSNLVIYHQHFSEAAGPSHLAQAEQSRQGAVEQPYIEKERWYIEVPSRSK